MGFFFSLNGTLFALSTTCSKSIISFGACHFMYLIENLGPFPLSVPPHPLVISLYKAARSKVRLKLYLTLKVWTCAVNYVDAPPFLPKKWSVELSLFCVCAVFCLCCLAHRCAFYFLSSTLGCNLLFSSHWCLMYTMMMLRAPGDVSASSPAPSIPSASFWICNLDDRQRFCCVQSVEHSVSL